MTFNELLFGITPYVVGILAIVVTVMRWRKHEFTVSSISSQLLESRKLYWGSIPFHWGLTIILTLHFIALIIPKAFALWNGSQARLVLLEFTGLALGLWAFFGACALIYRRFSDAKVRSITSKADAFVLGLVTLQIFTGVWIAIGYRWGSYWGTSVFVPYVQSLFIFRPNPDLVDPLPWVLKTHVLLFFAFIAVFPFTRLVHIITLPLQYFLRPWQKVVAGRTPTSPDFMPPTGGAQAPVIVGAERNVSK